MNWNVVQDPLKRRRVDPTGKQATELGLSAITWYAASKAACARKLPQNRRHIKAYWSVALAWGTHPFPSRTRKLSPTARMVLPGKPGGRVRRRRPSLSNDPRSSPHGTLRGSFVLSYPPVSCAPCRLTRWSVRGRSLVTNVRKPRYNDCKRSA